MKGRRTRTSTVCRGEEIAAQYAFGSNNWQTTLFGTEYILHILQKFLLGLAAIQSLIFRSNIHSLVPLHKRLQLVEQINDMSELRSIPIIGGTLAEHLEGFCHANFTANNKSLFDWVFFPATACITPSE